MFLYCFLIISSSTFTLFSFSGIPVSQILDHSDSKTVSFYEIFAFCFAHRRVVILYLANHSLKFFFHLLFSRLVTSDSLQPHGLQHSRLPCPSPSPGACSDSCPLTWRWCHPTVSFSVLLLLPSVFPSIRVFSSELALHIRWPKYWNFSFSISPSNEYSGLISLELTDLISLQSFSYF